MTGVCGKEPGVADLQDLLLYVTKGISMYAHRAGMLGATSAKIDRAVIENLFTTVTNVNFDVQRLATLILESVEHRAEAKRLYETASWKAGQTPEVLKGPAVASIPIDIDGMLKEAVKIGIEARKSDFGEDITGLMELLTYGLKGMAAYADHAAILGKESKEAYAFFHRMLDLLGSEKQTVEKLFEANMELGKENIDVMGMLDAANTETYGHPEPTRVRITPEKGKCILVSGHDLKDLHILLEQTQGKGINVYTHGEMLPCNAYPGLKKYPHLVGNYGGAWQEQIKEFDAFPGPILMTTNCIQKPRETYKSRIFTTGLVAWPGVRHITGHDFSPLIESALSSPGFESDAPEKHITVGFARTAVMNVAGDVISAVKSGKIRHFFLIGGCDGAKPGRNYYTEFARSVPEDCVILTLACGKYRFNKLEFGDIGGIPRLLDVGQCNDAYSAIQIAAALSKAFTVDLNGLPLSIILSWYEQKAVCILLSLLSLGIKNIRLGPTLPAFVTPTVLNVLVEKFNIKPTTTVEADLGAILPKVACAEC